ncbi:hypothetical protein [Actinoplanes regularis]|uniref:Uncharacterized protein n=1 Tax=Actinoplanes regularis TaxID=52697 RepID=A0A239FG67_9ACTN|nr:hypothetical protein [Actinoplanes regularis]GIE89563.1 hypothetical protein Are01nite_60430 [Actinoplanes regularis]SNS55283.1 hypothetical protein SAMN06264365_11843 [Actinoplanes regularis]
MSDDTPEEIIRTREFAESWCAFLGLPPPKPWTVEDEARYQAKKADTDRRVREWVARRESEAA